MQSNNFFPDNNDEENTRIIGDIPQNNNPVKLRPLSRVNASQHPDRYDNQNAPQNSVPQQNYYNNGGTNQFPQQQYYNYNPNNIPHQNIPPQYQENNNFDNKNGKGYGTIILVVITILLIAAIIAVGLFLCFRKSDDDENTSEKRKRSSSLSSYEEMTDESEEDNTDEPETTSEEETEFKFITTPDTDGLDYVRAADLLKNSGFQVEVKFEYSDTVAEDMVISQNIPPETNVEKGTKILITASRGAEQPKIEIPDVMGSKANDAVSQLESLGLIVDVEYEKIYTVDAGIVVSQSKAPKTTAEKGTRITITVSEKDDSQEDTSPKRTGRVITKETDLNVRKIPATDCEPIGTVPKGSTVEIIAEEGDWYKISFENETGYVFKEYIQIEN